MTRIVAINQSMEGDERKRAWSSMMIRCGKDNVIVRYEMPLSECCQSSSSVRLKATFIFTFEYKSSSILNTY